MKLGECYAANEALLRTLPDGTGFKLTEISATWVNQNCRPAFLVEDLLKMVFIKGAPPPGMSTVGGRSVIDGMDFGFGEGEIPVLGVCSLYLCDDRV